MTEETTKENIETTEVAESAPIEPASDSLVGSIEEKDSGLIDVPDHPTEPKDEYDYDSRLFNDDGTFNKDGAKEYQEERKAKDEKYEKRILDLRRTISNGKAPETADKYFEDFAPDERFMKFFDPANKDISDEDKETVKDISDMMANVYLDNGLNKVQGSQVSNAMLKVLESLGALDARTKDEKIIAKGRWIEDQKKELGANADNIIREAKQFIETSSALSAKTKNDLMGLMENLGAPFIDTITQLKDSFGRSAGGVPVSVANLGGLASDYELKMEYLDKGTSDMRRQEITALRAKSGRTTPLMAAEI